MRRFQFKVGCVEPVYRHQTHRPLRAIATRMPYFRHRTLVVARLAVNFFAVRAISGLATGRLEVRVCLEIWALHKTQLNSCSGYHARTVSQHAYLPLFGGQYPAIPKTNFPCSVIFRGAALSRRLRTLFRHCPGMLVSLIAGNISAMQFGELADLLLAVLLLAYTVNKETRL